MKKLNRTKPFGAVHGSGVIKFEQDGAFFNAAGAEIVDGEVVQDQEPQPPEEPPKKGGKGSRKSDAAGAEIDSQISAQADLDGAK